jgi:hypothetical protein
MESFMNTFMEMITKVSSLSGGKTYNPSRIEKLDPMMDKELWFATYKQYQTQHKVSNRAWVEQLPLFMEPAVRTVFNNLEDAEKGSLDAVQAALQSHYQERIQHVLLTELTGITKRAGESWDDFGERIEGKVNRLNRLQANMPFSIIKSNVLKQVPREYRHGIQQAREMQELREAMADIDSMELFGTATPSSSSNNDGNEVAMMAILKRMQGQLDTLQNQQAELKKVNSVQAQMKRHLPPPPGPAVKIDSSQGVRMPQRPEHKNGICYACGEQGDHYSWDCPNNDRKRKRKGFESQARLCDTCSRVHKGECLYSSKRPRYQHTHPPIQPMQPPPMQQYQPMQPPPMQPYQPIQQHLHPRQLFPYMPAQHQHPAYAYAPIPPVPIPPQGSTSSMAQGAGSQPAQNSPAKQTGGKQ